MINKNVNEVFEKLKKYDKVVSMFYDTHYLAYICTLNKALDKFGLTLAVVKKDELESKDAK